VPFFDKAAPWYAEYFDHERQDHPAWLRSNPRSHFAAIDLPAIHVGGWYDVQPSSTTDAFVGMRGAAPSDQARAAQRMIIGPWTHWGITNPVVGDIDFGPDAVLDIDALRTEWFGHWLQGRSSALLDEPPVRIFVMGDDVWRDEEEWPLARTEWTAWHLLPGGGFAGHGPPAESPPDEFTYDPRDPVPTVGGRLLGTGGARGGPVEQGEVAARPDVLAYMSAPLRAPLELTGPVVAEIWASTDAPDTDFTAKLVDVAPDGYAMNLADGIVRARYRESSRRRSEPLRPHEPVCFAIDLWDLAHTFLPGHRLRVEISSSSFPRFDRNPNTGHEIGVDGPGDVLIAEQRVFHDAGRPSALVLPAAAG
jgi:uncharacterized protein